MTFFSEILDGTRARVKANLRSDIWEALAELADEDGLIHTDPLTATTVIIARVYNESGPELHGGARVADFRPPVKGAVTP